MLDCGDMSSTTFILSGFASIPWLLTMKPKNFSVDTLRRHIWLDSASYCTLSGSGTPQTDELYGVR